MMLANLYRKAGQERSAVTSYKEVLRQCPLALDAIIGTHVHCRLCNPISSTSSAKMFAPAVLSYVHATLKQTNKKTLLLGFSISFK